METPRITKTVLHNGIEIRRSNEMTNGNAYLHRNPMQWVVDGIGTKHSFNTAQQAKNFIDTEIKKYATAKAYGDFSGNYWTVQVLDGKFTEVAISHDEYKAIKGSK
jgi:hypothetical protein